MQEVVPIVVTMAVRIVMMISTTRFKVNFFIFSYNFFVLILRQQISKSPDGSLFELKI